MYGRSSSTRRRVSGSSWKPQMATSLTDSQSAVDHGDMQLRWCQMVAEAAAISDRSIAVEAWKSAAVEAERQGLFFEAIRNRIDQARLLAEIDRTEAAAVARSAGAAAARMGVVAEEQGSRSNSSDTGRPHVATKRPAIAGPYRP